MLMILTVLLALQAIAGNASAATIYVEPGDSIQKAVDNARSGDTIVVKPGTYAGGIKVSTADLTIMSSSPHKAIIKAENNAFDVYESNVVIKNFDIRGPGKSSGVCFSFSRTEDWSATAGAFACTVQNNKISNFSTGASVGFYMHSGSENILNNDISNCGTGISVFDIMSETVTISGNRITNCDNGLFLVDAFCIITNNNFNNTVNVNAPEGTGSIFNTTKTVGKNIVGGPYLGGNYWATPSDNGFSQTHSDNDGDGFADEPYRLGDSDSVDYLPLIPLKSPVAAFSASPTSGKAPLKVKFTDKSTGTLISWKWDFGDGSTSKDQSPVHTYSKAGIYTVKLTVSNENGAASKLAKINVSAQPILPVFPSNTNPPTDLNQDGLYEDINGNGILDFDDVVAYYENMDWIEENASAAFFDYNKNGLIDFDDTVKLYDMF